MPNHVTTKIKASREVINSLLNEKDEVDFNNIIPMPEGLHGVNSNFDEAIVNYIFGENHGGYYESIVGETFSKKEIASWDDDRFENFIKMLHLKRRCGSASWYDWCITNWGTKWNAYDVVLDDKNWEVEFDTAWACPLPVIEALSKNFPDEEIMVKYADEDIGHNCGQFVIKNGDIIKEIELDDPILFAHEVKGWDIEAYYVKNPDTGKYEYDEKYE